MAQGWKVHLVLRCQVWVKSGKIPICQTTKTIPACMRMMIFAMNIKLKHNKSITGIN